MMGDGEGVRGFGGLRSFSFDEHDDYVDDDDDDDDDDDGMRPFYLRPFYLLPLLPTHSR